MPRPPSLVILAAGQGTRFGGNKQFAGFSKRNITLMELNALAAYEAGFRHVVFIIAANAQASFEQQLNDHLPQDLTVDYAVQSNQHLPDGVILAETRDKPLGTAHALWCCREFIDGPFVVTNADDYYGASAFIQLAAHFKTAHAGWAMVAYSLDKTLSQHGGVNRGLCQLNADQQLVSIIECLAIQADDNGYHGRVEGEAVTLAPSQLVSMNCWGLTPDIFSLLEQAIRDFAIQAYDNEMECMLPSVIMDQLNAPIKLAVYRSKSTWLGLTYPQDQQNISHDVEKIIAMRRTYH